MRKFAEDIKPVQLSWEDINYTVKIAADGCCKGKPRRRQILNNLRGIIEPGQMLAIMGPSGSGKTTMLNVLSGKLIGKFEGDVKINGEIVDKRLMKRVAGFVPQEDILLGSQTVYETLAFYASLKLPKTTPMEEKHELIMGILTELGLVGVKDTVIGYVGVDAIGSGLKRGLSGGERKRLSIGCQLISNPSLIFLDEPTTGLDSFAAHSVIHTLSTLSLQGRTIIFTIHQPSSDISELFDKILILGKGRTIYFGPNASSVDYFSSIGYECPSWENASDFFLNVVHGESKSFEEKLDLLIEGNKEGTENFDHSEDQALFLEEKFKESDLYNFTKKQSPPPIESGRVENLPGFFGQVGQLLRRNFRGIAREPTALKGAVTEKVIVALLIGLIFLQLERNQTGLQNFTGALFFCSVYSIISGLLVSFYMFPTERKIFLYQNQDGLYTSAAYYLSKMFAEIPTLIPNCVVYTIIFYFLVGFQVNAGKYFIFLAINLVLMNVAFACGILLICAVVEVSKVMQIFPIVFIPLMIFSGFYLNSDNTPPYFIWVEHISFLKYGFRAIMNNEFAGVPFFCKDNEFLQNGTVCPYTNGDQWLSFWNLDNFPIWGDILIMIEYALVLHVIAYFILQRDAKKSSG